MTDIKSIVEQGIENAIREVVNDVIAKKTGYGLDTDIQQLLRAKARELIDGNDELKEMLLNAMRSWISVQTADDYRKAMQEQKRRFG